MAHRQNLNAIRRDTSPPAWAEHAKKEFELYSRTFGIKPTAFGTTFTYDDEIFTVCGIKPRSFKFPVLATNIYGGEVFMFPADVISGDNLWKKGP